MEIIEGGGGGRTRACVLTRVGIGTRHVLWWSFCDIGLALTSAVRCTQCLRLLMRAYHVLTIFSLEALLCSGSCWQAWDSFLNAC